MLIAGIVTIGIQVDVAQHERRVALHRAHQAKQEAATSREVIAWLTEMFAAADPMATNRGDVSAREVMLATLQGCNNGLIWMWRCATDWRTILPMRSMA